MLYSVAIAFESFLDNEPSGLIEFRVVLVEACREGQAYVLAEEIAKKTQYNADAELVYCKYKEIIKIHELVEDRLKHGSEVFSIFISEDELKSLMSKLI